MSREHYVELGGETFKLHYTYEDREIVEVMFRRPDNSPGSFRGLVAQHLSIHNGSFIVQATILWAGLRHLERQDLTVKKVKDLLAAEAKKKGAVSKILASIVDELMADGVLGEVIGDETPEEESKG